MKILVGRFTNPCPARGRPCRSRLRRPGPARSSSSTEPLAGAKFAGGSSPALRALALLSARTLSSSQGLLPARASIFPASAREVAPSILRSRTRTNRVANMRTAFHLRVLGTQDRGQPRLSYFIVIFPSRENGQLAVFYPAGSRARREARTHAAPNAGERMSQSSPGAHSWRPVVQCLSS